MYTILQYTGIQMCKLITIAIVQVSLMILQKMKKGNNLETVRYGIVLQHCVLILAFPC